MTTSGLRRTRDGSSAAGSKKYRAASVATTLTACPADRRASHKIGGLDRGDRAGHAEQDVGHECLVGTLRETAGRHNGPHGSRPGGSTAARWWARATSGLGRPPEAWGNSGPAGFGSAELLEMGEQHLAGGRRPAEHQVHPGPRLLVLGPAHLWNLIEPLEAGQVRGYFAHDERHRRADR